MVIARPPERVCLPTISLGQVRVLIDALLAVGHIGMMHQHYTRSSFHLGEFQTGHLFRHACRGHVLVEIGVCHATITVIITSASGKQQHQGKEGQDIETDIFHK